MPDVETVTVAISVIGALIALGSAIQAKKQADAAHVQAVAAETQADAAKVQAVLAEKQLKELEKKVGMITSPEKMFEVLPVWYVDRMGTDNWGFGLLLTSADVLAISRIEGVSSDGKWMEVTMLEKGGGPEEISGAPIIYAPTNRLSASLRIESVQAAFEIWTS